MKEILLLFHSDLCIFNLKDFEYELFIALNISTVFQKQITE